MSLHYFPLVLLPISAAWQALSSKKEGKKNKCFKHCTAITESPTPLSMAFFSVWVSIDLCTHILCFWTSPLINEQQLKLATDQWGREFSFRRRDLPGSDKKPRRFSDNAGLFAFLSWCFYKARPTIWLRLNRCLWPRATEKKSLHPKQTCDSRGCWKHSRRARTFTSVKSPLNKTFFMSPWWMHGFCYYHLSVLCYRKDRDYIKSLACNRVAR